MCQHNIDTLSPEKFDLADVVENSCSFTHPADTEEVEFVASLFVSRSGSVVSVYQSFFAENSWKFLLALWDGAKHK